VKGLTPVQDEVPLMMRRFWVRAIGAFFLLLEAILIQLAWTFDPETTEMATTLLTFDIISGLAILAAIGFFFLRHVGWLAAMMVQGLSLFLSLIIYFRWGLVVAQMTMLYCVFMVLFLNSILVRTAFRSKSVLQENSKEI
jgi:hypothetical protein